MTPDLFNWTPPTPATAPYQAHSGTSHEAAQKIVKSIGPLHERILAFLEDNPSTDEQIIDGTGLAASTARPRRIELVAAGRVVDSGQTARTRSGRSATVWRRV